jgi:phytoene desaturase
MRARLKGLSLKEAPESRYDAVVIGAGVGGLITANLLQDAGMKTLLIEQHYVVGGYCSAFTKKGFHFDAASHFYPLLGNPSSMTGKLLARLSIPTEWVRMNPVDHFHFPDGSRYSVPADFDQYMTELKQMFPEENSNLDAFFKEVNSVYLLGLLVYFRGRKTDRLDGHIKTTLRQALDRHFQSEKLKLLLAADCPHWGSPPRRISYVFDSMLRLSYFLGNYYPKGGSQVFSDDLGHRFEELGGTLMLSCDAKKIIVKDGQVKGIICERGPRTRKQSYQIDCDTVVSNADMLQTAERLIGEEHLDAERVSELRSMRTSYPCYLMHIGLRDTSLDELKDAQGYHWRGWDPEEFGTSSLKFKFFVPTMFDPGVAPEGSQVIIIQKALEVDYPNMEDWEGHKAAIDEMVLENLKRLIPNFEERVVVRMSASARTSYRYTGNSHGAMLGWEMSPDQLGENRPGILGAIDGLYYAGHWTKPGGGITPVIVSAMQVAQAITGNKYM